MVAIAFVSLRIETCDQPQGKDNNILSLLPQSQPSLEVTSDRSARIIWPSQYTVIDVIFEKIYKFHVKCHQDHVDHL